MSWFVSRERVEIIPCLQTVELLSYGCLFLFVMTVEFEKERASCVPFFSWDRCFFFFVLRVELFLL